MSWTTPDILEAMGYDLADLHAFLHRQTLRKRWPLRRLVYRGYPHGPHPKASDKTGIIAQNFQRDLERYRSTLADYLIANVVGDDESLDVPYWMPRYEHDELHDRLLYWCRELDFRTIPGSWSRKVRKWETKSTSVQSLKMGWWHELLLKKVSGSGIALGGRSIGRGAALHAAATQSSQLRRIRHADSTCTASPTPKPQGYGRPRSRQAPIGSRRDHTPENTTRTCTTRRSRSCGRRESMLDELGELNPDAVIWPDFEPAFMGIGQQFNKHVAVYSYSAMIELMIARDGATFEEATEHIHTNTLGQYTGPYDPVVLFDIDEY